MSDRRVALIRGINVGKAKRVAMAELRTVVESLGYTDVRTLLNSGNLVFTVSAKSRGAIAPRIEQAMASELGVSANVIVLEAKELLAVGKQNSLLDMADHHSRLLVTILHPKADRSRLEALREIDWTPDSYALGDRAAYLWCAGGILQSKLAIAVNKAIGDAGTSRNWATISKLLKMLEG